MGLTLERLGVFHHGRSVMENGAMVGEIKTKEALNSKICHTKRPSTKDMLYHTSLLYQTIQSIARP